MPIRQLSWTPPPELPDRLYLEGYGKEYDVDVSEVPQHVKCQECGGSKSVNYYALILIGDCD